MQCNEPVNQFVHEKNKRLDSAVSLERKESDNQRVAIEVLCYLIPVLYPMKPKLAPNCRAKQFIYGVPAP